MYFCIYLHIFIIYYYIFMWVYIYVYIYIFQTSVLLQPLFSNQERAAVAAKLSQVWHQTNMPLAEKFNLMKVAWKLLGEIPCPKYLALFIDDFQSFCSKLLPVFDSASFLTEMFHSCNNQFSQCLEVSTFGLSCFCWVLQAEAQRLAKMSESKVVEFVKRAEDLGFKDWSFGDMVP